MREAIGQRRAGRVGGVRFALRRRPWRNGVRFPTAHGPHPFRVSAIYYDYSTDRGVVVMDRAHLHAPFRRPAADQPDRLLEARRERGRRARAPPDPAWRGAPRLHPHELVAPRRGAADLRQHIRDHLRPRSDRHSRRDSWRDGHARDAHHRAAPRVGAPAAGGRGPPANQADDRPRVRLSRRRWSGAGACFGIRAGADSHLRRQRAELRVDDSVPRAGRVPAAVEPVW